jgi:hypothetical protein
MVYFRRAFRRRQSKYTFLALIFILFLDAFIIASHNPAPTKVSSLSPTLQNEKIFIASIHRNSEYVLRLYWNSAILHLVEALGPQNVFVSILESGSLEDTKGALQDLKDKLDVMGVDNAISLGMNYTQQSEFLKMIPEEGKDRTGWLETGVRQNWELRRIPALAKLRNQAMEPLSNMKDRRKFDRVLWINDVVFRVSFLLL